MRELDGLIYRTFFELGLTPRTFNGLDGQEQMRVYNGIRFTVKSELARRSLTGGEVRRRGLKFIDRAVAGILFGE